MMESQHTYNMNDEVNPNIQHYVGNTSVWLKHGAFVCVHLSSVQNVSEDLFIFYLYSVSLSPRPFSETVNLTPKQATVASTNLLLTGRNLEQTYVAGRLLLYPAR